MIFLTVEIKNVLVEKLLAEKKIRKYLNDAK